MDVVYRLFIPEVRAVAIAVSILMAIAGCDPDSVLSSADGSACREGMVAVEDIGIRPRWDFLPAWVRELFASAVGTSVAVGLVICVVGFVVAGVMLIFARSQGMYGMGAQAKTRVLEVVAATIVIAGAVSLVGWFASIAGSSPARGACRNRRRNGATSVPGSLGSQARTYESARRTKGGGDAPCGDCILAADDTNRRLRLTRGAQKTPRLRRSKR